MNRTLTFVALTSVLTVACGGGDNSGNADALAQESVLCHGVGGTCAAVATSIFNSDFTGSGTLDTVNLDTEKSTLNIDATLDADTTLKLHDGELFVLQRDSGAVRIYDPATFEVKIELPVGDTAHPSAATYPQDLYIAPDGKIWVTLSGNPAAAALGIVDRNAPGAISYVALPQDPADTDGKPEPNKIYACNDQLYVTLQSYSLGSDSTVTFQQGRVVAVDPTTRMAGKVITLSGKNPADIIASSSCSLPLVANSSSTITSPDGTGDIEVVDLTAGTTHVVATDVVLGGRPTNLAANGSGLLFVAEYFDPQPNGQGDTFLSSVKVVAYDLGKNALMGDVTGKFGNVNFLQVRDGKLYFGAGIFSSMEAAGKLPRGLYITPADGTPLASSPIDLQLTPSAIALP